jgi:hypothetical protein
MHSKKDELELILVMIDKKREREREYTEERNGQ